MGIDEELIDVSTVKLISIVELEKDMKTFQNDYNLFQTIFDSLISTSITTDLILQTQLQSMIHTISQIIIQLNDKIIITKQKCEYMCEFYGESSTSINALMITLDEFLILFKSAKIKMFNKIEKEKKMLLKNKK